MKTTNDKAQKRAYNLPKLERIKLDSEISLTLESTPPIGPYESENLGLTAPIYFNNDPFKQQQI